MLLLDLHFIRLNKLKQNKVASFSSFKYYIILGRNYIIHTFSYSGNSRSNRILQLEQMASQ